MKTKLNPLLIALSVALSSSTAIAEYEINSFLTVGATGSNVPGTYSQRITEGMTLEQDTKYGVNLRSEITQDIYGAAQLLATGREGQFSVEAEWAYISYSFNNDLRVRAGKLNLQTFLHSDYKEVGYLYPHIRLPEEVYGFNPMRNFPGLEIMHTARLGNSTTLRSQIFAGSAEVMITPNIRMNAVNGYGANFQLDNKYFTIRAGAISPEVRLTQANHTMNMSPTLSVSFPDAAIDEGDRMVLATFGLSWDIAGFVGSGEYIKTTSEGEVSEIFPDREGAYLMVGYQMGDFLPHITTAYADSTPNTQTSGGVSDNFMPNPYIAQDSMTYGLRYEVDEFSAIKFEHKIIDPTLSPDVMMRVNSGFNMGYVSAEKFNITSISYDVIF